MDPWPDDLADDLQSLSFTSTTTTTVTTADIKRSTSFSSETTASTSARLVPRSLPPISKPHAPTSDPRWAAIHRIRSESPSRHILASDLRFSRRLGAGDISSVYLAELTDESNETTLPAMFAAKVMDKKELASRSKEGRAKTEREILELLDHPFLPTLYATIDATKWLCLLTEFCPGGDLHVLRQRQPYKRFSESAVRCARHHHSHFIIVNIYYY